MKLKKIIVSRYLFRDVLGDFIFDNVEVLISYESQVTSESFNQENDEYYISSKEVDRLYHLAQIAIERKNNAIK
jgi:hypothetical protein